MRNCFCAVASGIPRRLVGVLLIALFIRGANAEAVPTWSLNTEALSIEAPMVQTILLRAATLEQSPRSPRDLKKSVRLYCLAAQLGSLEAQFRLGKMILDHRGPGIGVANAASRFSIAAANGHEIAREVLEGGGVPLEATTGPDDTTGYCDELE